MSISVRCTKCKRDFKLGTTHCKACGRKLGKKYRVRARTADGRQRSQMAPNLKLAQQIDAQFTVDRIRQKVFDIPTESEHHGMTVAELWPKYYEWSQANKRSYTDDRTFYVNYCRDDLASLRLVDVKTHHVQQIITKLQSMKSKKYDRPYSNTTLNHVRLFVSRLFNWAIDQGYFDGENPASKVRVERVDNRITNPMSKTDIKRLLAFIDTWENERPALAIKYALFSGKRKSEILRLKWENVDLTNGFVTYVSTNTKVKETQTLPLNEECLLIILRCRELRNSDWVFPSNAGNYYSSFDKTWRVIRDHLKLTQRFHDLRHTFASYIASSGKVDIYTLQHLLGHKTITMTQRYAHLFSDALKKAINSISYD